MYICRCELALAIIICRTAGEVGLMRSLEGKELMVTSAPTVLDVHPWDVRDGEAVKGEIKRTRVRVRWEAKDGFRVHCRVRRDKSGHRLNWG